MNLQQLVPYMDLIKSFLENQIDSLTFEHNYLNMFKTDSTDWTEDEYDILNDLFSDVDAFCADPKLRDPGDLDEEQLRTQSKLALEKLLALKHQ